MNLEYVIIQAGGKGTRLDYLTKNKPKALVPINNLPMIFHCFKKFQDKKFIIIGDYKCDVLRNYLDTFADVKYIVIDAKGAKGTCGGLNKALDILPAKAAFLLIWSDLVLPETFSLPDKIENYIGISKDFECRWSYNNGKFQETHSKDHGVAGFFVFKEKKYLKGVPEEGEFVKWLQESDNHFSEINLYKTKEYGLLSEYNKLQIERCRPFNKVVISGDRFIKKGIDSQGERLAVQEKAWYKYVQKKGFRSIPRIYSYEPFEMEFIQGKNVFEYDFDLETKREILNKIVKMLHNLHSLEKGSTDYFSIWNNYYTKTFERLNKIQNLVPFAQKRFICINGKKCRNIFFYKKEIRNFIEKYKIDNFSLIHGDCTFSNMMLNQNHDPILIDPRGYFGFTSMLGDENYDWAKLYYSLVGDYDKFNIKKFKLVIDEENKRVELHIESSNWKSLESYFFEILGDSVSKKNIKMIHAIIWLSLTTYAWEDYDSICGAFYNGLLYFEEALNELS